MRGGEPDQVHRVEGTECQLRLDVAQEEVALEPIEDAGPEQTIVRRCERAAGYAGDAVDLIEQLFRRAGSPDVGVAQSEERAVGERGRTRASARERETD